MRAKEFFSDITQKAEYIFLILAIPFCLIYSIFIVPAGGGFDEHYHAARTESLLNGEYLLGPVFEDEASIQETNLAVSVSDGLWNVSQDNMVLYHLNPGIKYTFPIWEDQRVLSDAPLAESYSDRVILGAMVYNPLIYLPYCIGYVVGDLFTDNAYTLLLIMRLFGIATFCLCAFFAIRLIPVGKYPFVVLALTPDTLASICTVTADVLTTSSCYLLFAITLKILLRDEDLTWKNTVLLAVATLLVTVSKMTYAPLLLLLLLLPICNKKLRTRANLIKIGLMFCIGGFICVSWYYSVHNVNTSSLILPDVNPSEQVHFILSNPITYASILFKALLAQNMFAFDLFGVTTFASEFPAPSCVLLIVALAISFVCSRAKKVSKTETKTLVVTAIVCWFVFFCVAVLIFTALYMQFSAVGSTSIEGVQPRYFAPILPLLVLPFVLLAERVPQNPLVPEPSVQFAKGMLATVLAVNTVLCLIWVILVTY